MQEQVAAIIVAAGSSRRMGGRDKLWLQLAGRIILARTVEAFVLSPLISTIILVLNPERLDEAQQLRERENWQKIGGLVAGGSRRQDSVRAGLDLLAQVAPDTHWVMIHDGARPLVTSEILETGLKAAQTYQAAVAAVPVKDTIKHVRDSVIESTPERSQLWAVQTPQIFAFPLIYQAHHADIANTEVTDDASLLERLGHRVAIFPGSYTNLKITTQEDLLIAEALIKGSQHS